MVEGRRHELKDRRYFFQKMLQISATGGVERRQTDVHLDCIPRVMKRVSRKGYRILVRCCNIDGKGKYAREHATL